MSWRFVNRFRRWRLRRNIAAFHSPKYRLPVASFEALAGFEPRRADYAYWFLLDRHVLPPTAFQEPTPIAWSELERVHTPEWLESITHAEALARVFAVSPSDVPVDEVLHSLRLACGGTLAAARMALHNRGPVMNFVGGFHHASRGLGGGFCVINDIAVAIASLRADGLLNGRVAILDLDAHPPDGTADCLEHDPSRWIGSLSGSTWNALPAWVDETVLPAGASDETYLAALDALLLRMPKSDLTFVLAGGDVLAGDQFGTLRLTLAGVRERDRRVRAALDGVPSVWLPAGGYSRNAWRVLAGTALALALDSRRPIANDYDPMVARFRTISAGLAHESLGEDDEASNESIEVALGLRRDGHKKLFLGYYTAQGIEYGFGRFGVLDHVQRLGYANFRVAVDEVDQGDRLRLFGQHGGQEHLLVEVVEERKRIDGAEMLYVHWLTLRHPIAAFDDHRPRLPGQETPGLGLAREAGEFLAMTARRLGLSGVAFRPAYFHTAYVARDRFRFVDPERHGRFLALVRDLKSVGLKEATTALAEGRVRMNGAPYAWEADVMASWIDRPLETPPEAQQAAADLHFTIVPAP